MIIIILIITIIVMIVMIVTIIIIAIITTITVKRLSTSLINSELGGDYTYPLKLIAST